ncbi:cation transporting ATPase C-terminal domain-containing protein [Streptomyces kronopolitis]|uniref:cation transporting ATPase C-terminal domain-containing protein n=1 Tax=Streptomyces kronopolitis TaxID=1612435 RepID=UPI0036CE4D5F
MTVARMWAGGRTHLVSGVGYAPVGEVEDGEVVRQLLLSAVRCSNARLLMPQGSERWRVLGDTTEGALLVAAAKAGVDPAADESVTPRTAEYPFDSDRKLMSTVTGTPDDGYEGHVKGAPHAVLARCSDTVWQGRSRPLDETARRTVDAADDELASQGLRVLAVARRTVSVPQPGREEAECRLTLLGLAGMFDPPRPEVSAAVTASRRAGIRIIMLTGDHPLTAEAVARRVGIVRHQDPVVVSGAELDALDEAGLDALLARRGEHLLCRVSPEHKTWVVEALQRRGDVVAVTGDGANDVSALKHADIGDGPPAPAPARSAVLTRGAAPHPVPRGHPGRRSVPVFFWHINATGMPYAHFTPEDPTYRKAITLVQAGIVVSQFFNALAVRTERESIVRAGLFSNPWLLAAGAFGIGLMAAISHLSPLQAVFHTAPLSAVDWAVLVALGALLLTADEARKAWLRRHAASERGGVS